MKKKEFTYGLTKNVDNFNPVVIAFHEWRDMLRDVRQAKTWRGRIGYFIASPGWREDGTGTTSSVLRAAAKAETNRL